VAPPKSDFEREMAYLESEVRRLEAEFNMFFAGRLPRPPWETRAKVAALVKRHDQSAIRNTADRFRFESLQNRHQKFLELWERQMNNREVGRTTAGIKRPPPAVVPAAAPPPADANIIRFTRDQQVVEESELVKRLFERLAEAKKQVGEPPVAIERLAALVRAQVGKFAAEGKDVSFRVAMKDGKVSLTARPTDD
jgi:hypothetical protein